MISVGILGGAGHIAKTLSTALPQDWRITLYSSHPDVVANYLVGQGQDARIDVQPYDRLATARHALIINAAGPGDPARHRNIAGDLLELMERYDRMALDVLGKFPDTAYIYLSSGAIYGTDYSRPVDDDTVLGFTPNRIEPKTYYALSKLVAEARHRAAPSLKIADVRVFGYFTRHIDAESGFFLTEIRNCLMENRVFETPAHDFVRDIVSPEDLAALIVVLFENGTPNGPYDAVSAKPTTKFEMLDALSEHMGLTYRAPVPERFAPPREVTRNPRAATLGYQPQITSLDLVVREMGAILSQ